MKVQKEKKPFILFLIVAPARLDFYQEDVWLSDEFLVVPGLSEELIIGATTMQKLRLKLDFENDCVIVNPRAAKLILINLIKRD